MMKQRRSGVTERVGMAIYKMVGEIGARPWKPGSQQTTFVAQKGCSERS